MPTKHNLTCEKLYISKTRNDRFPDAQLNGFRTYFKYPGKGVFIGDWKNDKRDGNGALHQSNGLIYEGQWKCGMRNGQGTVRKSLKDGNCVRIYMGEWKDNKKHGEGKKFYKNGVYYGYWKNDKRVGLGIMWYNDGRIYIGEWADDTYHGYGVLFQKNCNRYEGSFVGGEKDGEGLFYHMQTGQVQKGFWQKGICKCSILQDEFRQDVIQPTKNPIPKNTLENPDDVVRRMFEDINPNFLRELKETKKSFRARVAKLVKKEFSVLSAFG